MKFQLNPLRYRPDINRWLPPQSGLASALHPHSATCAYPYVKGITVGVNSPYNQWRMEDAWLDK